MMKHTPSANSFDQVNLEVSELKKQNRLLKTFIGGMLLLLLIVATTLSLGKRNNLSQNQREATPPSNQLDYTESEITSSANSSPQTDLVAVQYQGHYYNPIPFTYSYPRNWHVWYGANIVDNTSERIENFIYLNPVPYEISEFGKPAISGSSKRIESDPEELFEVQAENVTDIKYNTKSHNGLCKKYSLFEAHSGTKADYISCIIRFNDNAFIFTLNDLNFEKEFKNFIESIHS